jgi:hypothetical protein
MLFELKHSLFHLPSAELLAEHLGPIVTGLLQKPEALNFLASDFTYYRVDIYVPRPHQALLLFCHANETVYILNTTCQSLIPGAFQMNQFILPKFDLLFATTIPFMDNLYDLGQSGYLSNQPKPRYKNCEPSHTMLLETCLDNN